MSDTPGYDAAQVIVDKLVGAGMVATVDPRSATPPCVLVTPPDKTYDVGCGFTAGWQLWAIAPGPANADAWVMLDRMTTKIATVLPVARATFAQYVLSADSQSLPAYRVEFDEGV